MPILHVTRDFTFEAAHQLPDHPGPCANLHGHSYRLEVTVTGSLDQHGMVIDFDNLSKFVNAEVIDRLDHTFLNDLMDYPTAERIAQHIWDWLSGPLPGLSKLVIHETARNRATMTRE